jgi:hypothetical protein
MAGTLLYYCKGEGSSPIAAIAVSRRRLSSPVVDIDQDLSLAGRVRCSKAGSVRAMTNHPTGQQTTSDYDRATPTNINTGPSARFCDLPPVRTHVQQLNLTLLCPSSGLLPGMLLIRFIFAGHLV